MHSFSKCQILCDISGLFRKYFKVLPKDSLKGFPRLLLLFPLQELSLFHSIDIFWLIQIITK